MKISAVLKFFVRHHFIVAAVLLVSGSALLFGPALNFPAEWFDDRLYITENHFLEMTWDNFLYWYVTPILQLHTPLQMHSYMLDRWLWGEENFLFGLHLVNVFWHTAGALGFYLLLLEFGIRKPAALFFALLFSLHPQRLESVVWVSERKDVLAFCFAVWGVWFFIRALKRDRFSPAAGICLILSLLGKPMAIMFPAICAIFIFVFRKRPAFREILRLTLPLFIISALYMAIYPGQISSIGNNIAATTDILFRVRIIVWNYTAYFLKTFLPLNLTPIYPFYDPEEFSLVPGLIAVVLAVGVVVIYWRRREFRMVKLILATAAGFTLTVLPMVGLTRLGNTDFADRYSYLPSIFIWLATAAVLGDVLRRQPTLRRIINPAALIYLVTLTTMSVFYLDTWRSRETFEMAAMEPKTPNYLVAMTYGLRCWSYGNLDGCRELLDSKLPIRSHYTPETREAIETYRELLTGLLLLQSDNPEAGYDRLYAIIDSPRRRYLPVYSRQFTPMLLAKMAEVALVRRDLELAAILNRELALIGEEDGDMVRYHFYMGVVCQLEQRWREAEQHYLKALESAPDDANILGNLEVVRARLREK